MGSPEASFSAGARRRLPRASASRSANQPLGQPAAWSALAPKPYRPASFAQVFGRSAGVHALVLSPCCLKGWLGKAARRQAESQLGGAEPTRRAAALAGGFQAASK